MNLVVEVKDHSVLFGENAVLELDSTTLLIRPGGDISDGMCLDYCLVVDPMGVIRPGSCGFRSFVKVGDFIYLSCRSDRIEGVSPEITGYQYFIVLRIIECICFSPTFSSINVPLYEENKSCSQ